MKIVKILVVLAFVAMAVTAMYMSNSNPPYESSKVRAHVDIQGHRGARGLLPENTIPGFIRAIDIGVHTLELDVVITKDKKVVLSHEPFMSHSICTAPDGSAISEDDEKSHNIYQLTYEKVAAYDCGSIGNSRFPDQQKMAVSKPLLSAVIDSVESYVAAKGLTPLYYNIETKSTEKGDNVFHPEPEEFVDLLAGIINEKGITSRAIIQSFDPRTLRVAREKYPDIDLALLIEDPMLTPEDAIKQLGFTPDIYSPYFKFMNSRLFDYAEAQRMRVIPWTVNTEEDIEMVLEQGVHGIISDYPNRVVEVLKSINPGDSK